MARRLTPRLLALRLCAVALGLVVTAAVHGPAQAAPAAESMHQGSAFDDEQALAYSQAAIGRRVGDHAFRDTRGNEVRLSDYRGRPLVVNLVYTSCEHVCPTIVETLAQAVGVARGALGADGFAVVTVGFDVRHDTPARMRAFAKAHGAGGPNWRFLSGDEATIEGLSRDLGFIFFPSPKGFDHLAQTTLIDGQGRVYRHIYGAAFDAPALVEPLKRLALEKPAEFTTVSGLVDRIRLFCTFYDPSRDRYYFDYSILIGSIIGALALSSVGFVLVRGWLRQRHVP